MSQAMSQKQKIKANHFEYTGRAGELFKVWLVNILLMIPTLGIYRFWAKAKIRRYQASHVRLDGSFFEHTGNGRELFRGFAKFVLPIICLFILLEGAMGLPSASSLIQTIIIGAYLIFYAILGYLFHVAQYASFRYMATRTTWRGIRGYLGGSALKYGRFTLWRTILNIVSLGFLKPKSDILKHKYKMNNLQFGSQKMEFHGNSKGLMKPYILGYMVPLLIPLLLGILIGGILKGQEMIQNAETKQQESLNNSVAAPVAGNMTEGIEQVLSIAMPIVILICVLLFMLFSLRYKAALTRKQFGGMKLGDLRFKSKIMGWPLFKLYAGNFFIFLFTLGFGQAIVWRRNMVFFCDNTVIGGDLENFSAQQIEKQKAAGGDSLADTLDVDADIGLDVGF